MIISALLAITTATQTLQIPTAYLPQKPSADTVLAKVDGVPIKASDVERLLWDWRGREVTQDLISYMLIHKKADALKIVATPADIQKEYDTVAAQQAKNLAPGQTFDAFLREKGQPKSRFYMQLETNLLISKIADAEFNPSKFMKVSTLLFKTKSDKGEDTTVAAAGKAHDAYTRLTKGEDWEKVLNTTDQDPQIIKIHGLLGWVSRDNFPPMTQAELKTAKAGTIIQPTLTSNGIQLFKIESLGTDAKAADLAGIKAIYDRDSKQNTFKNLTSSAKIEGIYAPPPPPAQK